MNPRLALGLLPVIALAACGDRPDASTDTWKRFTSPTGFYALEYPASWTVGTLDPLEHTVEVVGISPEDGTGAVTLALFRGERWRADAPDMLSLSHASMAQTSPRQRDTINGAVGVRQSFRDPEGREWIAVQAGIEDLFVYVTANEIPASMPERRETYERILRSIALHPAADR
jgi:hypothetical protein